MAKRKEPLRKKFNEQKRISMGLPPRDTQKILIISEGHIEVSYFKKINSYLKRKLIEIKPVCSALGTDALNVVNSTIEEKKKCTENGDALKSVWSVFDIDCNRPEQIQQALKKAQKNKINVCISNPCFEVWLLSHYSDSSSPIVNGEEAKRKIKEHISNYDSVQNFFHNNPEVFDELMQKKDVAVINSQNLDSFHNQEFSEYYEKGFLVGYNSDRNRSTHIYKLINKIFDIINKEMT